MIDWLISFELFFQLGVRTSERILVCCAQLFAQLTCESHLRYDDDDETWQREQQAQRRRKSIRASERAEKMSRIFGKNSLIM